MLSTSKAKFIISGNILFLLLLILYLIRNPSYTIIGLCFASLVIIAFYLSYININHVFGILIFTIPLSINIEIFNSGTNLFLPSEFLLGLMVMAFFFYHLLFKEDQKKFLRHNISILIILYFIFYIINILFSTMMIVSLKAVFVRFCYITVFYFFINVYIKKRITNIVNIYLLYGIPLTFVVLFTLFKHSDYLFSKDTASAVVNPFYADHTIYSACIAFIIPAFLAFFLFAKEIELGLYKKISVFIISLVLLTGLFYSYSRGAWISLVGAVVFLFILLLKIRLKYVLLALLGGILILYINKDSLIENFSGNKFDSNAKNATLIEQTKSITNISNDLSNAERLNRWKCAIRMFNDKPLTGFGPGTYQFQYLPYQVKSEMTRISVTSPWNIEFGKGGTAHSEYFLLLSETGIFQFLIYIILIFSGIYFGVQNYYKAVSKKLKVISAMVLLGFVTYAIHGLFNNFLDTDKAAFLFWSSLSIIVSLDTYFIPLEKNE